MCRSFKKHMGHYILCSVHSSMGKRMTSRHIRRAVRQELKRHGEDFDYVHHLDNKRGRKGSRDEDWGGSYFGDGYRRYWPTDACLFKRWGGWRAGFDSSYDLDNEETIQWFWRLVRK